MELSKEIKDGANYVDTFKDPFQNDKVVEIQMTIGQKLFTPEETEYKARIRFKNGNTTGNHKIEEEDFPTLLKSVESFLKTLK